MLLTAQFIFLAGGKLIARKRASNLHTLR